MHYMYSHVLGRANILTLILLFVGNGIVCAQDRADGSITAPAGAGLQSLDWALIALYAISTVGLGLYFSRQQRSTEEYFVGSGNMNPFLIGVSLFATLLSTISYLSMPGEAAGKGPVNLVALLAYPVVYFIVAYAFLPIYMRQRVTSAYELLEDRLGLSIRLLGAIMFLTLRLVWMSLLVYLAAKAVTIMIGVDYWKIHLDDWTIQSGNFSEALAAGIDLPGNFRIDGSEVWIASVLVVVLFTGLVSVVYTTLGGLRAVVVTDFMQTILLFGGAILVIATVTWDFGGFGWMPMTWQDNWDIQPLVSLDPGTRVTVLGTVLSVVVWYVATSCGDQTSVQRFMSTRDVRDARRALATQLTVGAVVGLTLYAVGFALLGYFRLHADALPAGMSVENSADDLFPRYISYHLPVGISGLVVAAMFAAAMSSIDSGVNSITAVVMTDFLDRFGFQPKTEKGHLRLAKLLAFAVGVSVVVGSSYMKYIEGNITAITNKTVNLLTTPIFCLFVFALFIRRVTARDVWIATICGTTAAVCVAFSGPLVVLLVNLFGIDPALFNVELVEKMDPATGQSWLVTNKDPISFQWISPVALVVTISVGYLASVLLPTGTGKSPRPG